MKDSHSAANLRTSPSWLSNCLPNKKDIQTKPRRENQVGKEHDKSNWLEYIYTPRHYKLVDRKRKIMEPPESSLLQMKSYHLFLRQKEFCTLLMENRYLKNKFRVWTPSSFPMWWGGKKTLNSGKMSHKAWRNWELVLMVNHQIFVGDYSWNEGRVIILYKDILLK